jgi:hypothetical protein
LAASARSYAVRFSFAGITSLFEALRLLWELIAELSVSAKVCIPGLFLLV